MLKKILPAVTGAIGFAIGGPMGASIGAGLGSAARGDNPANIATSALMGFGLGGLGASAGLVGGQGLGAFGKSIGTTTGLFKGTPVTEMNRQQLQNIVNKDMIQKKLLEEKTLGQKALGFIKDRPFTAGALGLGALGALGGFKEEEDLSADIPPSPEPGSQGMLDVSAPSAVYYDPTTRAYGAASPQIPEIYRAKDGGDIKNFPRKVGQIDGPGTEKSDDIPAMLSDGEFVMTAQAVRGLGALNGADKDDKLEQRRKGAKMMYEMMDKFESKVA